MLSDSVAALEYRIGELESENRRLKDDLTYAQYAMAYLWTKYVASPEDRKLVEDGCLTPDNILSFMKADGMWPLENALQTIEKVFAEAKVSTSPCPSG